MKRAMHICGLLGLSLLLAACESWNWKRSGNEMLKSMCRGQANCYATCPDGTRTNPNSPYCPGERPQDQPEPF